MWDNWSTPKKLMMLSQLIGASVPAILRTVTGSAPISLPDAVAKDIPSLIQYGKCVQNGTPTPDTSANVVCNNGTIKWDSVNQRVYADGTDEVLTVGGVNHEPQTVSVVDLFSVGDITDEQEIIGGTVTKRIGYHVFDGTETFSKSTAYGKAFLINAASAAWGADRTQEVLCTHFLGLPQTKSSQDDNTCFFNQTGHFYFRVVDNSDTDAFKTWLAEQYGAGTPVIVWFVLAEPTTESVAPQELHAENGTVMIFVESNVDPVDLSCRYYAETA